MAELQRAEIQRVSGHSRKTDSDTVITEGRVLIRLNGRDYREFYCLPTRLEEMVRGHLVAEGVCHPSDVRSIEVGSDGEGFVVEAAVRRRRVGMREIKSEVRTSAADIRGMAEELNEHGALYKETGATHVAGIFGGDSAVFAEDVSRHCAIDKAIGLALQKGMNLAACALVTSCRQTESTIRKAVYSRIPVVISIAAVTSLAVEIAKEYGITLIGFARSGSFNIYSHEERVKENG
jgi:FdhD protein